MYIKLNDVWDLDLKNASFHADFFYYIIGSRSKIEQLSLAFVNGTVETVGGVGASQTIRPETRDGENVYVMTAQEAGVRHACGWRHDLWKLNI